MNEKLRVKNGDEILNLDKIVADKLENNASRNDEILNVKSKIGDGDETSNLGEIIAGKLAFYCITNLLVDIFARDTIAPNHLTVPLIVPVVPPVSDFSTLSSAAPSFLVLGYPAPDLIIFLVSGLPAFSQLGLFIVPLIDFDTFFHDFSFAFLVNSGIVKLLAEVIANFFSDNPFIIVHLFHNDCISEKVCEVGVANLFSAIFDT